LIIKQLAQV